MVELSIIVPCRNDERRLPETIGSLNDVVTHSSLNVETLIVDDESADRTLEVAQELSAKYPAMRIRVFARKRLRRGFGSMVRYAMAYSNGRYCCLVSSDGHDPVALLPKFLQLLRNGAQLVQCTRYEREEDYRVLPIKYRVYQAIYRQLTFWLLHEKITDTTYGFRAFDRIYIQALGTSSARFDICPEITYKVLLGGGKIEFVPGSVKAVDRGGSVKFQLAHEIWGYGYVLLRAGLHRVGLKWF
ncbi:MAG: glycosyltransferase family 2 protein [Pseudomonadota bacterium]